MVPKKQIYVTNSSGERLHMRDQAQLRDYVRDRAHKNTATRVQTVEIHRGRLPESEMQRAWDGTTALGESRYMSAAAEARAAAGGSAD